MNPSSATLRLDVEPRVLERILTPYRPHCRYLKRAWIEARKEGDEPAHDGLGAGASWLARAHGEFAIPESWYIEDTGHFNSIEFNLCYNQLVYVLLGQCALAGCLAPLGAMGFEEFLRRQLPDVLIVEFTSTFRRAMDADRFRGTVSIERTSNRGRLLLIKTHCDFADEREGFSEGRITLAITNWGTARAHA